MDYRKHFSTAEISQKEQIPGRPEMVQDSEGGYVWQVDDWQRLERFLVLGAEGGTYYISERKLSIENAEALLRCIKEDGLRVVQTIVDISESGRAPKNDPALFALAVCAAEGDLDTRQAAFMVWDKVARIGTHLFYLNEQLDGFRGWGRGRRNANARWYNDKPVDRLAYQVVKYRQRHGYTHWDLLRLAHPIPIDKEHDVLYQWIANKSPDVDLKESNLPNIVKGYELALKADTKQEIVNLITTYGLTREMIPTQWLKESVVWEALLDKMPMTAMIRNLGVMGSAGLLQKGSWDVIKTVTDRLSDDERLRKARIHPIAVLNALTIYSSGKGLRGSKTWDPVSQVMDALDAAFYKCFHNVEPTKKRLLLALDVSASMGWSTCAGAPFSASAGSAAMALVTANVEPYHAFAAFSNQIMPINISPRQRLDDVIRQTDEMPFGGTDCAQPMIWALENRMEVDTFIIFTDNETWAGSIHPVQALEVYRRKMNIPAKLIVVGMASNGFTIADPDDAGMLDVIGFDASAPAVMSDFIK